MRDIIDWSVSEQLHRIECLTPVIAAENDCSSIEDSRHETPVDQPEIFINVLRVIFLQKQTG
jgi:hypothetical protein